MTKKWSNFQQFLTKKITNKKIIKNPNKKDKKWPIILGRFQDIIC